MVPFASAMARVCCVDNRSHLVDDMALILGTVFAGVGAIGVVVTTVLAVVNRNRLIEVHALVNSQLTTALDKIDTLKVELKGAQDDASNRSGL
jgi:hypothetical protein